MYKKLTLFLYLLSAVFLMLALLIETNLVWASQPSNIQTNQDPQSPVSVDINTLILTNHTKDESDYFLESKYTFVFWRNHPYNQSTYLPYKSLDSNSDYCAVGNFMDDLNISNKKLYTYSKNNTQFKATLDLDNIRKHYPNCKPEVDDLWHFRLWPGDKSQFNTVNPIVQDYTVSFAQSNNTTVSIQPIPDSDVYINENPTILISNTVPGNRYSFWWDGDHTTISWSNQNNKTTGNNWFTSPQDNQPIKLSFGRPSIPTQNPSRTLCMGYGYANVLLLGLTCDIKTNFRFMLNQVRPAPTPNVTLCTLIPSFDKPIPINSAVHLKISNLPSGTTTTAYVKDVTDKIISTINLPTDSNNEVLFELLQKASPGTYSVTAYADNPSQGLCEPPITFSVASDLVPTAPPCAGDECTKAGGPIVKGCNAPNDTNDTKYDPSNPGIPTAIGCIHTNPVALVKDFLKFALGISGGLAFLLMILGAFQMLTSAGNPETLNAGKERLTSAVIGLLLIIFSVLLLQIIGFDILGIPGFGR